MKSKIKKLLFLLLILGIVFPSLGLSETVHGETISSNTYYVGGPGASDVNSGTSSAEPFATISHAASTINSLGAGSYKILVQGEIIENKSVQIGDGINPINVAITNSVTGSAIVFRDAGMSQDFIVVNKNTRLTLGDNGADEAFILDGKSENTQGPAITVKLGANFEINSNVILQNHNNSSPAGYGGGIYNLGTVTLMGGTINNNKSYYGGGIYNKGTLFLRDAAIRNNIAQMGGGIYNSGNIYMTGGRLDNNNGLQTGGGIYNTGNLVMEGGSISNNTGAIYSLGTISLSGDASIPWDGSNNFINLNHEILIPNQLSGADKIALKKFFYQPGQAALAGSEEAIASSYTLFELLEQEYEIDSSGKIVAGSSVNFYVGGENASDLNIGTDPGLPFETLEKAVNVANEQARGSIITLQSDTIVRDILFINNDITIQSDDIARAITPEGDIWNSPFVVVDGTLTLGGDKTENSLLFKDFEWTSRPILMNESNGTLILKNDLTVSNVKILSFIENNGTLLIEGGSYHHNEVCKSEWGEKPFYIRNSGSMIMSGGTITDNLGPDESFPVIENRSMANLNINGGNIQNNQMSGIWNAGSLNLTNGFVTDNRLDIQIVDNGDFTIYEDAAVSSVYLQNTGNVIQMEGDPAVEPITIRLDGYSAGREILRGLPALLEANYTKFALEDSYSVYYVGGTDADDNNNGTTKETPLSSLGKATQLIGSNPSTIILQSDITISDTLFITGSISIISDGSVRTIYRGSEATEAMFRVSGKLTLGNSDYSGSDSSPELILDGNKDKGVEANKPIIENTGDVYLYPGIVIQNNENISTYNPFSGIYNNGGALYMYGGVVQNNISREATIININKAKLIMTDGCIRNNEAYYSGVCIVNDSSFLMEGGSIRNNVGIYGSGVIANNRSVFTMKGGTISGNNDGELVIRSFVKRIANGAGVNITEGSTFIMEGGNISNNSNEYMSGVIIYDSTFVMTEGNIIDNTGGMYAGVLLGNSNIESKSYNFTMNDGNINGNFANFSGIYSEGFNITLNGGAISENTGTLSGIITKDSNITMNGGTIDRNMAEQLAGIGFNIIKIRDEVNRTDLKFMLNGGVIEYNKGLLHGIVLENKLQMSGNAVITGEDELMFYVDSNETGYNKEAGIELTGRLPSSLPDISVAFYLLGKDIIPITDTRLGKQIVFSGNSYNCTWEDMAKFKLISQKYAINYEGRIGTPIKDNGVTISEDTGLNYDKGEKTVTIKVKDGSKTLISEKDYTTLYQNNVNAGTAQIIILGKGDYAGTIYSEFTIHPKDLSEEWVTMKDSTNLYYDGKEKTVDITVYDGEAQLIKDVDYKISYRNNIQVGDAEMTITGIGNYTGTFIKEFTIYKKSESLAYYPPIIPDLPPKAEAPKEMTLSVTEGRLTIDVNQIPKESIEEKEEEIFLTIPSQEFVKHIAEEDVTDANIRVRTDKNLLNNSNKRIKLLLKAEVLKAAKNSEKDLSVSLKDQEGREQFTWNFSSGDMKSSQRNLDDVNLYLEVHETEFIEDSTNNQKEQAKGLMIDFHHEGQLPSQARVRIYVGDKKDIKPGSRIYLYHINKTTGLLETLPFSSDYQVDEAGYIEINILHCSDYAIFTEEADSELTSSLRDQISVVIDKQVIYAGGDVDASARITVTLPPTLELVKSFKIQTSQSAIGGVTVTYRSSNEMVASVDGEGRITAKKKGNAIIYVTMTLYSGKTKIVIYKVKVKEPYIQLIKYKKDMELGSDYRFKAVTYGLDSNELVWTTKQKSTVIINKDTGVAIAKSRGTDYVVATIHNISKEMKVVVK